MSWSVHSWDYDGTQDHKANSIVNSATVAGLQDGACYNFDGSADFIDTEWGTGYDSSTGITVAGWGKADNAAATGMFAAPYKTNGDRFYRGQHDGDWKFGYKASGWDTTDPSVSVGVGEHV